MIQGFVEALGAKKEESGDTTKDNYSMTVRLKQETDPNVTNLVDKVGSGIVLLYKAIKNIKLDLPKVFRVTGKVNVGSVESMPPVQVQNLNDLGRYFQELGNNITKLTQSIVAVAAQTPPQPKIELPEITISPKAMKPLLSALGELRDSVSTKGGHDDGDLLGAVRRLNEAISTLANRPSMTAQPVTHVSLNSMAGSFLATTMNLTTTAQAVPSSSLSNRRSMIIYNNSVRTVYLGDSSVTTSGATQGLPVPATSYSPPLDAGTNMTLYGIAAATSSITVLEMSDESSGR